MSARPRRIRETRSAARKRFARALGLVAVALVAIAASACGDVEPPPPAPNPEPPAVSSSVASATRTPPPAPSPTPTPEPKIDRSQAALVRVGETVAGEIERRGGFDLFRFRADEGRWYQVDAALRSLGDSMLDLYDSNGQWLAYSDNYPGQNGAARIVWRAAAAGDHYAKVSSPRKEDYGTYQLSVVEVDISDKHGDSEGDAADIAVGTVIESALEYYADEDWFRFQAEAGVLYEIYALFETAGDVYDRVILELYDFHGEILNSSFWFVSEDGKLFWKATKSGDHYVRVKSYYFVSEIPYSLTVDLSDVVDDHPDNSMGATSISDGTSIVGSIDYGGDSDCFRFRAKGGRTYRINSVGETLWSTQTILYSGGGETLAAKRSVRSYPEPGIVWKAPASGDYYIRVGAVDNGIIGHPNDDPPAPPCEARVLWPDGPTGTYTLEAAEFSVWDVYPDDDPSTIPPGHAASSALDYPNDVDNFRFEAEKGRDYTILLTRGTLTDVWANLYGEDGVSTIESILVWKARSDRTYDISVRSYIGDTGTYSLAIIPTVPDTGADIVDDHANEKENATRVSPGKTASGSVDYPGDYDYFVFQAEAGREYSIRAKPIGMGGIRLKVHDFRQELASARDESGAPAVLLWTAPSSMDYYVETTARENEIGDYRLTLE